jgi:hypothetical protein
MMIRRQPHMHMVLYRVCQKKCPRTMDIISYFSWDISFETPSTTMTGDSMTASTNNNILLSLTGAHSP